MAINTLDIRFARARVNATTGAGNVAELLLPSVEGQVIVPHKVVLTIDGDAGSSAVGGGLSFYRNIATPTDLAVSLMDDPSMWLFHSFGDENTANLNLLDYGIELAGPQALAFYNGTAGTLNMGCVMYYTTRTVPDITWAQIAMRTSIED